MEKIIKLGIGFATGRKGFHKVLNSYMYSWKGGKLSKDPDTQIRLSLFVTYDTTYSNAKSTDFTN